MEDQELQAMSTVINVLAELDNEARSRVMEYLLKRMSGDKRTPITTLPASESSPQVSQPERTMITPSTRAITDIRSLTKEKKPRSDNQMAALVAYYLSEIAPSHERKDAITTEDITKYFKQAGFELPVKPAKTLSNAKDAGYFDVVSKGNYKLNPVGYNLVAHSLTPKGS